MPRRVLIVSPHFPPVNAPDMQRVRAALPFFVEAGWEVTVLTVADPTPVAPLEPELMETVPAAVQVERAHCFSRHWTGRLGVNNVALRSLPFLFVRGCGLLLNRRYDVVYFSTTMFIALPLGRLWRDFFRVPYVIDLQDPWVSNYYDRPGSPRPPGGWKYRFAQAAARGLEGWTLRGAAHLIVVSSAYVTDACLRHPALRGKPATELPFAAPASDLAHAAAQLKTDPLLPATGGLRLAFAGALGPGMMAGVNVLFAAMAVVRSQGIPVTAAFFGTSYSAQGQARPVTLALAAEHGLQDAVSEKPDRLPYFEAIQITLETDANLLFGSTDLAFTPSKILGVLAAGKPVVAIAPAGSAMNTRLAGLGQPTVTFAGPETLTAAINEVAGQLQRIAAGQAVAPDPAAFARYSAQAVATRQLEILEQAATA